MGWLKYLVPILIGVLAAYANFSALKTDPLLRDEEFLVAKKRIAAGAVLKPGDFDVVKIRISGEADEPLAQLRLVAVLKKHEAMLSDAVAVREFKANDLLLWRDLEPPRAALKEEAFPVSLQGMNVPGALLRVGDEIKFIVRGAEPAGEPVALGPFAILSVGDLAERPASLDARDLRPAGGDPIITLRFDFEKRKPVWSALLTALKGVDAEGRPRVLGVALAPKNPEAGPAAPTATRP